ncbi:MAG: hypothetical protein JW757_09080 [Anaerolineales bacterium]|nr:hypothetical protein [Anaerolineales bacterium]
MNPSHFLLEIRKLFRIALVQKAVIVLLRAAWVGGGVYILCWGTNRLWSWFPQQDGWTVYAALVAIAILVSLLRYLRPNRAFVWRLDRTFELGEQVFTAYERIHALGEGSRQDPGTQMLLESEAVANLPKIRRRVIGHSWQFQREIESTIVVLLMLVVIYLAGIGSLDLISAGSESGLLPPVPKEPQARDIFRRGIPGEEIVTVPEGDSSSPPEFAGSNSPDAFCDPNQLLDQQAWQQTQQVLNQLGERLCCGSAALQLSQALKFQDYQTASDQFSVMAEKIVDYSDETRQLLADQFLESSVQFQQLSQPDVYQVFSEATAALLGDSFAEMAEGLDGLALLMQQFERQQRCISIADWQPGSQWVPADQGTISSGILEISSPSDFYSLEVPSFTGVNSEMLFYEIPLEDADVVSSYFSPE